MATTLLGILVDRFDDVPALVAAVPTGIYVSQIPETKPLPYVVLVHGGEVPDWNFQNEYVEEGRVQFYCYALTCQAVEEIATLVKSAYDWEEGSLVVTGGDAVARAISLERTNYLVSITDLFRAPSGEVVYEALVEYQTRIRRTYV